MYVHTTTTHTHTCTYTTMCTQDGFSPLYSASAKGHGRIVEMLLQAGATVDLQTKVENCLFVHLSLVVCHAQYSLYTKYHTTVRGICYTCLEVIEETDILPTPDDDI